jgi:hypothetical protein
MSMPRFNRGSFFLTMLVIACSASKASSAQAMLNISCGHAQLDGYFYAAASSKPETKLPTILALHRFGGSVTRLSNAKRESQAMLIAFFKQYF